MIYSGDEFYGDDVTSPEVDVYDDEREYDDYQDEGFFGSGEA